MHRPVGAFGRAAPVLLPYTELQGWTVENGTLVLWRRGREEPVMKEYDTQLNFYAGVMVLEHLCGDSAELSDPHQRG